MIKMSDLYIKVDEVDFDDLPFDDRPRRPRVVVDGHSIDIPVDAIEGIQMLDLGKRDEGIKKLLLSICKMSYDSLESVFGERNLENILSKYTFSEIRERYDDWKKPKVGDEVECNFGYGFKAIILDIFKRDEKECATLLVKNDESVSLHPLSDVEKTGRHFDNISISALAEYMGAKGNSLHF